MINTVLEIVDYIKETQSYKELIEIKLKMSKNKEIMNLIKNVKYTQKEYVKSGYDMKLKSKLDSMNERLNNIPIYNQYLRDLEEVNRMIDLVRDELNNYFEDIMTV